jgi:ubiquinone/menaquinone biosynthesis C-methylase UbiE
MRMNGSKELAPPARSDRQAVESQANRTVSAGPGGPPLHAVVDHLGVLGDPTRMRILLVLDRSEFNVGELCQALQLPQSTVSRHLRTLSEGGWVTARSEGTSRVYRRAPHKNLPDAELWAVVKEAAARSPEALEDGERSEALLAERRERSRSFFRSAAGRWDALRQELFGARTDAIAFPGLLEPEWTVGDLGCGTGALSANLAPWVHHVIGVDREPEMLEAAERRLEAIGNVELRRGDLEVLPIGDGKLDVAFALLVFHLLPDPPGALAEVFRVLRPGGAFVLLDMRSHTRDEYREEMGHLWAGFPMETMAAWFERAGFEGVRTVPVTPDPEAKGPLLFLARGRRPLTPRQRP